MAGHLTVAIEWKRTDHPDGERFFRATVPVPGFDPVEFVVVADGIDQPFPWVAGVYVNSAVIAEEPWSEEADLGTAASDPEAKAAKAWCEARVCGWVQALVEALRKKTK